MESSSFQTQLLSVMDVVAKAAVAEIHRRVDDSCAVLRLEVNRSRRDIDLLKKKCEVMEAELRRSRFRARKKASRAEQQPSFENAADPGSLVSPTDGYETFPEQQLNRNQSETELIVKLEKVKEPDENAIPLESGHKFVVEETNGQAWSSNLCRDAADPRFSYVGRQNEQIPSVFTSQSGLVDMLPRIHSVGKSHSVMVSAARAKKRARTFAFKRPQQDEGHSALSQINSTDQSSIPLPTQHPYRDSTPHMTNPNENLMMAPNPAALAFCGLSRGGGSGGSTFGLARRMRTPWRSGIGEKRFSCTYCDKSFMRFSQLKEHLRSHTGEKPFSCTQCGRSFTKQCNLIRHAVVHSGEKPYECSLCGKCFTQRSSLKSHQKTAH
ncbi:hypothetical protein PAMP_005246 [Pampus punctatissimus]